MRKILSLITGFGLGAAIGGVMVTLFAPESGKELAEHVKRGYAETMAEARQASTVRRAELENQLAQLRAKNTPAPKK
jgi:gas vesicle protein